jgi:rfaE bifunctional protein nucleotidyltransferase chain/domain
VLTAARDAVAVASQYVASGRAEWRHERTVAVGGCFDVLHAGHVRLLEHARTLGDRVVILLNSDASVSRLKGPGRPLNDVDDRRRVLLGLATVDDVVVFDEDDPCRALADLRPDVFVKGSEYADRLDREAAVLDSWGGRIELVPMLSGRSTTRIVNLASRAG